MNLIDREIAHLTRMDFVVRTCEIKWGLMFGITRLVPPELAAKFDLQWLKLSEAIMLKDHEGVMMLSDGVIRGIWAMERAAILEGHIPHALSPIGLGSSEIVIPKAPEYKPTGKSMNESLEGI